MVVELEFRIYISPTTGDSETRIIAHGKDVLETIGALGLDPPFLFAQPELQNGGPAYIGRCTCGQLGCGSFSVEVTVGPEFVDWMGDAGDLRFSVGEYFAAIGAGITDSSWEDAGRTAERLVSDVLRGTQVEGRFFSWASARYAAGEIALYYSTKSDWKIYRYLWDTVGPSSAVTGAEEFKAEHCGQ